MLVLLSCLVYGSPNDDAANQKLVDNFEGMARKQGISESSLIF